MIHIFGHRNPDTDSICSAIALAELKNLLDQNSKAYRLGPLNKETAFVLDYFGVEEPPFLEDAKTQIKDIPYAKSEGLTADESIAEVFNKMHRDSQRSLAVVDKQGYLKGLVTMHDIAMNMIHGDIYHLDTSLRHLKNILKGEELTPCAGRYTGQISVAAYYNTNEKLLNILTPDRILIVGDRYEVIETAIENNVPLILVSGGHTLPEYICEKAEDKGTGILSCALDTYTISKLLTQCNEIGSIAITENLKMFREDDLLEVAVEVMENTNFSTYPVVDKDGKYLGFIARRHVLQSSGKKVILVDHNESSQSAPGIKQANILEVVDHHRIGDLLTNEPIYFRNEPVGSTCTIVERLYREVGIEPSNKIKGLLLSGILSDTLNLLSPTTTLRDREAVERLEDVVENREEYVRKMFTAGSHIEASEPMEKLLKQDFKRFDVSGKSLGISQLYTMDRDSILAREKEILDTLKENTLRNEEFVSSMLVITDILSQGSYIYAYSHDKSFLIRTFGDDFEQGQFLPGILSRKKQIVPVIMQKNLTGI
ncbi:MAG TPA: putative manganese-dependent inorganic diphosphatase [Mogibacterium sp.]|nr:putative manganese-dependent inorganic diphosphatase [Mogibacterium sp.]